MQSSVVLLRLTFELTVPGAAGASMSINQRRYRKSQVMLSTKDSTLLGRFSKISPGEPRADENLRYIYIYLGFFLLGCVFTNTPSF